MKKVMLGLISSALLLNACGGGGSSSTGVSSGSSGSSTSAVSLYFTDDASIYPAVNVKVYEVNLCSDNQCNQKVNLFKDQNGLTTNLAKLNGVLQYINTSNIPQGTYNRLEVIMDQKLTITDQQNVNHDAVFTPMQEKPNKPNVVQCDNTSQKCYIRFNGAVQPFASGNQKLVIDFVLKEFEVNTTTNPWQVYEVKMKPLTPDEMKGKNYENKLYVKVQSVNMQNNNYNFTASWMNKTYTINVNQNTKCEINNQKYTGTQCLTYIQPNMCVEVKVQEDPATTTTLTAIKLEQENIDKCK